MSVTVRVVADKGSGKTTIAREIYRHLRSLGLACSVIDDEENPPDDLHQTRLRTLANQQSLVVVVTMSGRVQLKNSRCR